MVDWFNAWSKGIVGTVIITTLVEMIIPNNNSKKYIKILLGIFIVYTIVSPVIDVFSSNKIDEYVAWNNYDNYIEASSGAVYGDENACQTNSSAILNVYIQGLQNDIRAKLKTKGYIADKIDIIIANDDSYNIEYIAINISEKIEEESKKNKNVGTVVDNIRAIIIKIDDNSSSDEIIDDNDRYNIKQLLNNQYDVSEEKIRIN